MNDKVKCPYCGKVELPNGTWTRDSGDGSWYHRWSQTRVRHTKYRSRCNSEVCVHNYIVAHCFLGALLFKLGIIPKCSRI
jgi:hypothetical protein